MSAGTPRTFSRSVFRAYVQELRRSGLFDQVRARASERLRPLLDDPDHAPPRISAEPITEVTTAVHAVHGREGVRELGYRVMKSGFTTVLEPIIHLSLSVFGATPASLFGAAPTMLAVVTRGVEMKWKPSGRLGGTVRLLCGEAVPELNWVTWEGTCVYILELAKASGTVGPARPAADGRSCEIDVSWHAK